MDPLDRVLSRLTKVRKVGDHQYTARCPAHKDRRLGLSVAETDNGSLLLMCRAGCSADHIVRGLGLELTDLLAPSLEDWICTLDHRWFEAHPGVIVRRRPHVLGEFEGYEHEANWYPGEIVVVRVAPGWHVRCLLNHTGFHCTDLVPEGLEVEE